MEAHPPHSIMTLGEGSTDWRARAQKMVQQRAFVDDLREEVFEQRMWEEFDNTKRYPGEGIPKFVERICKLHDAAIAVEA